MTAPEETTLVADALQRIGDGQPVAISPLVADLIMANHRSYTAAVNAQVENLEATVADLQAELGAIRTRINDLFSGDYMPTQDAIVMAVFYPSRELINRIKTARQETQL